MSGKLSESKKYEIYQKYLSSAAWKAKRLRILERDGYKCLMCDAVHKGIFTKEQLEVHHRHYRNLFNEPLEDLATVCPECHDAITNVHRSRRLLAEGFFSVPDSQFLEPPKRNVIDSERPAMPKNEGIDSKPKPKRSEVTRNDVANIGNGTKRGLSTSSSQRTNSRSSKRILERDEKSFFKKKQDRS